MPAACRRLAARAGRFSATTSRSITSPRLRGEVGISANALRPGEGSGFGSLDGIGDAAAKGPSPQPSPRRRGEGATTVRRRIAALRQNIEERLQMPVVMPPAPDRAAKDRLSHLPEAGREDRPLRAMKIETRGLPVEAEEF